MATQDFAVNYHQVCLKLSDEAYYVLIIFKAQGSYCSHIACSGCMIMYQNFLLIFKEININLDD